MGHYPRVIKNSDDVRLKRGAMSLLERVAEDVEATLATKKQEKAITTETIRQFVRGDRASAVRFGSHRALDRRPDAPLYFAGKISTMRLSLLWDGCSSTRNSATPT